MRKLDKLQKLQNRAARVITGRTYEVSSKYVLNELNWQPLRQRFRRNKSIFMYKIKNDSMPQSLTEMFKIRIFNNKNFALQKPETNFMKKSISYSAAFLWNSLPDLGLVQTSNFSCAESNVNEQSSLFELICITFGT